MIVRDVSKYQDEYYEFDTPDDFLSGECEKSGLYGIRHRDGVYTDVLFWNQHADVTIVCFNGAGHPSDNIRPNFNGTSMFRSWRDGNRANLVFVHDATLYLDGGLNLAWYGGSRDFPYQDELEAMIRRFVSANTSRHLVFFGVSGGGHAALNYAARFPGSIAVAGNPQTNVDRYENWAKNRYYQTCWSAPDAPDLVDHGAFLHDMVSVYAGAPQNFAYCLVNADDHHHVHDHLVPLIEATQDTLNVRTLLRHWGSGNTASPPGFFLAFFDELIQRRQAGEVFPSVQGARLLEDRGDVKAVLAHQVPPVEANLFRGQLALASSTKFDLSDPVTGTMDLTLAAYSASSDAGSVSVEFVLDRPSAGRYVYGLRITTDGYQANLSLRPNAPSTMRVYLPSNLRVTAIWLAPSEKAQITLTGATLVAYSPDKKDVRK